MPTIYEPEGRAKEFADLALSVWYGCDHLCDYCFNSTRGKSSFKSPEAMKDAVAPCRNILQQLKTDLPRWEGDPRHILLQFTGDPYPRQEADQCVTRQALKMLKDAGLTWDILTKSGTLACRDFDLYADTKSRFAQTVVLSSEKLRKVHEAGAAPIKDRFYAFAAAKAAGIPTWCSLEPIWDVDEALKVLQTFDKVVDVWKVGKINEHEREKGVDWDSAGVKIAHTLDQLGAVYYIKKSLRSHMPKGFVLDNRDKGR